MNYDPNMTSSGRMAKQRVRLTFGQWDYRLTVEEEVGGNCTGMTVIETAVTHFNESLDPIYPQITLANAAGDTLLVSDDEDRGEDWLADMLIGAEIVSIEADESATKRVRSAA